MSRFPEGVKSISQDDQYMRMALREAELAYQADEIPVGAVVVYQDRIIGRGHNQRELLHDPTAHAEMLALTAAAEYLVSWRLEQCTLYVTLEPCPMCAGALVQARLSRLVFGALDPKAGACGSLYNLHNDPRLNHRFDVTAGVLADDSALLLRTFFQNKRRGADPSV
ncbi:MAG: tRNA-specific adenosine deaminase [Phycisphaerae bacterium]|nr:tRNA-specific adenosine deaminase [Phycisphaerae bacterium]